MSAAIAVAGAVVVAGSAGAVIEQFTAVPDPADTSIPTPDPTPTESTLDIPTPDFSEDLWMTSLDIPTWVERFTSNPRAFAAVDADRAAGNSEMVGELPRCVRETLLAASAPTEIATQTVWYLADATDPQRHYIHHHLLPEDPDAQRMIECLEPVPVEVIASLSSRRLELYLVRAAEPYLVAIGLSADGPHSLAVYMGPDAASDMSNAYSPGGATLAIAGKVNALVETEVDPHLPTSIPEGVWLEADDLAAIDPSPWTISTPQPGLPTAAPLCVSRGLEDIEVLQHQMATTASGEQVIQIALLQQSHNGGRVGARLDFCTDTEAMTGWDGTVTSTSIARVRDLDATTEFLLTHYSGEWNGEVLTIYIGSRVDEHELPPPSGGDLPEISLELRDLAGHGGAFRDAYVESCSAAGACD